MKYADLSTSANRDYKFDLDQMVSLNGDTSRLPPVRVRPDPVDPAQGRGATPPSPTRSSNSPRRSGRWACTWTRSATLVYEASAEYAPHKLAAYLYQLASLFTTFYDQCPVLKPRRRRRRSSRTGCFLCDLTARTLHQGMALLGIRTPERL